MRWLIFIVIYILIDIYAFQALKTITPNKIWHYSYLILSLLVVGNLIFQNIVPQEGSVVSGNRSYAFGLMLAMLAPKLILVIFMFGEDIIRFFVATYYRFFSTETSFTIPSRRKFISQVALGIAAIPFASLLYGMIQGKYNFRVLKYELSFDDLPEAFNGYQITQISDIHSGSFDNFEKIKYAVNLINEQQSDAIFFTGDMVNNKASEMDPWKALFGSLKAKDGVFSILGNHDYGDYVDWANGKEKAENLLNLKNIQKENTSANAASLGKALKISTELVASVVVGSTIGFLLDNWFDTKPLLTICFFIMGVAAGILNVFRSAKKMQKKL
mgnify:CR=1 FL=1